MTPNPPPFLHILTEQPSVAHHFIAQLRNVEVQGDRMRFRRNMERLGEVMAYEVSKALPYETHQVTTPLGTARTQRMRYPVVLATVLRAALPLFNGFLNVFEEAESAFIGAYRGPHQSDETFDVEMNYLTAPGLNGKILILIDPMLATGKSMLKSYEALLAYGAPVQTHIVAAIASRPGVQYVQGHLPKCRIWAGAVDDTLNYKYYIMPGLGDAGDLAFGVKQ
jgi:uracil phosphoribosyltransferase